MANLGTSLPRAMYLRGSQRDSRSACAWRIRGTTLVDRGRPGRAVVGARGRVPGTIQPMQAQLLRLHEDWLILES